MSKRTLSWSRHVPRYFGWKFWRWGRPTITITMVDHGYKPGEIVTNVLKGKNDSPIR